MPWQLDGARLPGGCPREQRRHSAQVRSIGGPRRVLRRSLAHKSLNRVGVKDQFSVQGQTLAQRPSRELGQNPQGCEWLLATPWVAAPYAVEDKGADSRPGRIVDTLRPVGGDAPSQPLHWRAQGRRVSYPWARRDLQFRSWPGPGVLAHRPGHLFLLHLKYM